MEMASFAKASERRAIECILKNQIYSYFKESKARICVSKERGNSI